MKPINVISLFDGMSCGQIALERVGIPVENYYAAEIDKHAISVAKANWPNMQHMGDVNNWKEWPIDWANIDLIIAGSPCQGFSFAGKQLAFDDPRSKLFFVFVDILNHIKSLNPNVKFLLENVRMKKEFLDVITQTLGVEPVMIDSQLVCAQRRKRFYWANWSITQPKDKGILLKDIVHEHAPEELAMKENWAKWFAKKMGYLVPKNYATLGAKKACTMTTRQYANWNGNFIFEPLAEFIVEPSKALTILENETKNGKIGFIGCDSQSKRFYSIHGKSVTLCAEGGGMGAKMGLYLFGCITPQRLVKRQNGQRFNDGQKFYTLTAQDQHGIITEGYIRKLSPIECERLQTVPDGYTNKATNTQRYKMLGNGWTVDVIGHIFKAVKPNLEEIQQWGDLM